jgi:hypothetical protein
MCAVPLPPGVNPTAVDKYIIMLEFSGQVFEKFTISNFMKIRQVDTALFHVDGRTDRHDE